MTDWKLQLRNLRRFHGLKQCAIAECLNVTQATVSRWETGKQVPDLSAQRRLRELMNKYSTRVEADIAALMCSPLADRSLLDTNFVIAAVSEFGLKSIGANASDMIGKCAHRLRQDAQYEKLVKEYDAVFRRGEFISCEGRFFSKRYNGWIATYTVPVVVGGQVHLLSDRRSLASEAHSKPSFSIKLFE